MSFKVPKCIEKPVPDLQSYKQYELLDKIQDLIKFPLPMTTDLEYIEELVNIIKKLLPDRKVDALPNIKIMRPKNSIQCLKDLWDLIKRLFPDIEIPQWDEPPEPEPVEQVIPLGIEAVGAPLMWEKSITGKGVLVGVIDTGIVSHPDFGDRVVISRNFAREIFPPAHMHGTHVAGTIAANGGIVGVAKDAKLADYRVLNKLGSAYDSDIAKAIRAAADDGCKIINMSLGGPQESPTIRSAVTYATQKGALIVAAVGNEGDGKEETNEYSYPAMYPEVLGVASINYSNINKPSPFSNSNDRVDCCSHGEAVLSTGKDGGYLEMTGTSMACPHVAGIAALVYQDRLEKGLEVDPKSLKDAVLAYAKDVYLPGKDNSTGLGFVTFRDLNKVSKR